MQKESLVRNIGLNAIFWIATCIAVGISTVIQYLFLEYTGKENLDGLLPSKIFNVNPICYTLGAMLCITAVTVISLTMARGRLEYAAQETSAKYIVIWYIQVLLGLAAEFAVYCIAMVFSSGLFDTIEPDILLMFIFPVMIYQLILLIGLHIRIKRSK